ncbi:MAG TPA: hypothetical protein VMZ30_09950 [Pyrinomonadaceae bacterium]|nr:hypothetical protein [Pyrinomonadaceae bacterium]
MSSELIYSCEKKGCEIGKGGDCLEGFAELDECPHLVKNAHTGDSDGNDSRNALVKESANAQSDLSDKVSLPGTDEFTLASASEITLAYLTRLIVVAGEADSGKTTLLASFIDRFQRGPFSGYRFAGSSTLMGFEQRCHLARLRSGGTKPDTDRTPPSVEHNILHLTVRSIAFDNLIQDLLFTDISGENFRLAKDFVEDAQRLEFLHRADRFVLFIDGENLASPTRREEAFQGAVLILRRCVETGVLDRQSFVDVVFNKIDLIEASDKNFDTSSFLRQIEERINRRYGASFGRLRFFTVDARHISNSSPRNQVAALFSSWVVETPIYDLRYHVSDEAPSIPKREIDRYRVRRNIAII